MWLVNIRFPPLESQKRHFRVELAWPGPLEICFILNLLMNWVIATVTSQLGLKKQGSSFHLWIRKLKIWEGHKIEMSLLAIWISIFRGVIQKVSPCTTWILSSVTFVVCETIYDLGSLACLQTVCHGHYIRKWPWYGWQGFLMSGRFARKPCICRIFSFTTNHKQLFLKASLRMTLHLPQQWMFLCYFAKTANLNPLYVHIYLFISAFLLLYFQVYYNVLLSLVWCCCRKCFFKSYNRLNFMSHLVHSTSLVSQWTSLMCFRRHCRVENDFSQVSHFSGLNLICLNLMCLARSDLSPNILSQMSHLTWLVFKWTRSMWPFRTFFQWNTFSQMSHL